MSEEKLTAAIPPAEEPGGNPPTAEPGRTEEGAPAGSRQEQDLRTEADEQPQAAGEPGAGTEGELRWTAVPGGVPAAPPEVPAQAAGEIPGWIPDKPPVARKSPVRKALLPAAVILIAVAGLLAVLMRDSLMKSLAPERYLQKAMVKTAAHVALFSQDLPDLAKYAGHPVSMGYRGEIVSLDFMDNYGVSSWYGSDFREAVENSYVSGAVLADLAGERLRHDFSLSVYELDLPGNTVYITPQEIALKIPALYDRAEYLIIDPENFARRWNDSDYAAYGNTIPESYDLQELLDLLFHPEEDAAGGLREELRIFQEESSAVLKTLLELAEFSYDGEVSTRLGRRTQKMDKMSYLFPEEALQWTVDELLAIYERYLRAVDRGVARGAGDLAYLYESQLDMLEELRSLEFIDDLEVAFFIDKKGLIAKIETGDLLFVDDSYFEDDTYGVAFTLELTGEGNLAERFEAVLDVYNDWKDYHDEYSLLLGRDYKFNNGVVSDFWELEMREDRSREFYASMDLKWDPNLAGENNFTVNLRASDGYYYEAGMDLEGHLSDVDDRTALTGAQVVLRSGGERYLTLGLDLSIEVIDGSQAEVDTGDRIDFFEADFSTFSLFDFL